MSLYRRNDSIAPRNDRSTEFRKAELKAAYPPKPATARNFSYPPYDPPAKSIHNRPRQPAARNAGIRVSQQSDLSQIRQSLVYFFANVRWIMSEYHGNLARARGEVRLPRFFPIHMLRRQITRLAVCELIVASTANRLDVESLETVIVFWTPYGFRWTRYQGFTRRKYAMPHFNYLLLRGLA